MRILPAVLQKELLISSHKQIGVLDYRSDGVMYVY